MVTVTGKLAEPNPGEILKLKGRWLNHPKYGKQFKITNYESVEPASAYGIEKYLGSGMIKGIGPVMAKKIVDKFKEDSLKVIENDIQKLTQIDNIGPKRIKKIKKAWDAQKDIRDVMI
ncbi:MAG: YrrC family ATP-dependent DNA helicase, partial [Elusimicrobiota bacterium]